VAYSAAVGAGVLVAWSSSGLGQDLVFVFGGTSVGSPQWAGLISIIDELVGYDIGFVHHGLYLIEADRSVYRQAFHDITLGNNTFSIGNNTFSLPILTIAGYNAGAGWDPASGLGSPNGEGLARILPFLVSPLDGLIAVAETNSFANLVVPNARNSHHPH
jgi:subtilase family serine protease